MHRHAEFLRRNKSAINRAGRIRGSPHRYGWGFLAFFLFFFFAVIALDKNQARRRSPRAHRSPVRPGGLGTRPILRGLSRALPAQRTKKEMHVHISGLIPDATR